ncbi:MAG: 16S rRNA (cytosine(1402)-N(4))-methyltransferase RsmH [Actinomycetia bacterium]|nr:16S rRNA (cytosine(1402)-N(4))-methyltransferase RsmH [Actinomycetes bacterium]
MTAPPAEREPAQHVPVMADEVLHYLAPALSGGGLFVDATLGLGGHTAAALAAFPACNVLGIDRDAAAIDLAAARLADHGTRFRAHRAIFHDIPDLAAPPKAFLFDLGVSSMQIDSDDRGFAYSRDTNLDMRMDQQSPLTAADVVNSYSVGELASVFRRFGEDRNAGRIARAIVEHRSSRRFTTTGELAEVVFAATPQRNRRSGHPAKRVFQAIRIEVNAELDSVQEALSRALQLVDLGGRVLVISYHSLEDRITKRTFASGVNPDVPEKLPVVPEDRKPWLAALTRGAQVPSASEVVANPRSASAKLRVVEKIRPTPRDWVMA